MPPLNYLINMFSRLTVAATLLAAIAAFGSAPFVFAQDRPAMQAHRVQEAITVDGQLTENAWQQASPARDFRQLEPSEGNPASEETEVRVLYGASNLYIGAILHDGEPSQIRQTLGRRDNYNQADWFTTSIDSYFNQSTAYVFAVNAAGVQLDAIRTGEGGGPGRNRGDTSWDAVWESTVRVTDQGWVVEMRIPYSMLRFSEDASTWGIHFTRRMPRLGERVEWPLVPRTQRSNLVANYGLLQGLQGIAPRRNVQVRPYTVSRLETAEASQRPGELQRNANIDVGGDVKVGISSNITLDATINPDFGQVETDPAVLNLTAFETFYEEKRPFFMEGTQIYEFGLGRRSDLLYTRRIGAAAPIVGAAKLSGRTIGGLSFGGLAATTGQGFTPRRHYGVGRLSQEFGRYSSAGGILTAFDGPTFDGKRRRSLTGGGDWDLRFLENTYGLSGWATFSHRRWPGQSPETGVAASVEGAKRQGIWTYDAGVTIMDDQFDPNDLGRLRRNNYINLSGGLRHDINGGQPFGPFQRADMGLFLDQNLSYRERIDQGAGFFFFNNWTTRNFRSIGLRARSDYLFGGYDLFETRGLGPRAQPIDFDISVEFETDERRRWQMEPEVAFNYFGDGGREYTFGLRGDWDVGSRVSLSGNVELGWEDEVIAWSSNETFARGDNQWLVGTESAPPSALEPDDFRAFDDRGLLEPILAGVDPFASDRYFIPVFGARDTRSIDFTLRSSFTFTPDLSVEFYGQLFVARGRYENFQLLQDRDTLVPFDAFPKRDVFSLNSLQANTVLRWEYQPGSTLYLVWTQGRRADNRLNPLAPRGQSPYQVPTREQLLDTFSIFPRNVFLIKVNYTFLR